MTEEAQKNDEGKKPGAEFSDLAKEIAERTGLGSLFRALATPENREALLTVAQNAKDRVIEVAGEIRKDAEVTLLEARLATLRKKEPGPGSPGS